MADEHEDGIERLQHEGRVFRWGRRGPAWPGHTTFVTLRGGEVVMGDRYAGEGVERTYACHPQELLDGCFQALVSEQLGPRVLEELLAEARRELRVPQAAKQAVATGPRQAVVAKPAVAADKTQPAGAQAPIAAPLPPMAVSARSVAVAATGAVDASARVDVAIVACRAVDLPLAVALRGITRTPVQALLGRLRSLPCTVLAGVSRAQAEGVRERLAELGATIELVPARAS